MTWTFTICWWTNWSWTHNPWSNWWAWQSSCMAMIHWNNNWLNLYIVYIMYCQCIFDVIFIVYFSLNVSKLQTFLSCAFGQYGIKAPWNDCLTFKQLKYDDCFPSICISRFKVKFKSNSNKVWRSVQHQCPCIKSAQVSLSCYQSLLCTLACKKIVFRIVFNFCVQLLSWLVQNRKNDRNVKPHSKYSHLNVKESNTSVS